MKATLQPERAATAPTERAQTIQYITPEVNIYETKDGLEITLEGLEITITGRRTAEIESGEALFRERHGADYRRVFELDPVIDTAHISARMNQGVLFLTLPKSEQVKPRKIAVND